jgi:hypothetical protein
MENSDLNKYCVKKPKNHGGMSAEQKREYHQQYLVWYRKERKRNREEMSMVPLIKKTPHARTIKINARNKVHKAIKNGTLVPLPCEQCGECVTEAHHDDYSKPLVISWLCKKHHIERHIELSLSRK